jgi:hypothetical protein
MALKKIGFIDYFLDEWHANNYPKMIHNAANGGMEVAYAYGQMDSPEGGMTNKEWAEKFGVELVSSVKELTCKSDYIIVLSPNNPEMHEKLSKAPLESGKRVYIDKTFATGKDMAERIFQHAKKHNTPCFSCSALNFSSELAEIDKKNLLTINSVGPGIFDSYSVHQIEPIVRLFGTNARRVMSIGTETVPSVLIEFDDGRFAQMTQHNQAPFWMSIAYEGKPSKQVEIKSDFFANFITAMVKFFKTGEIPVPHEQTIRIMAVRAAGLKALKNPFHWVEI